MKTTACISCVWTWALVVGCGGSPPAQPTTPAPVAPPVAPAVAVKQHVISLRGSNTIGIALMPKLVQGLLASKGATNIQLGIEGREREKATIHADLGGPLVVEIFAPGTTFGFQSLAKKNCDLVMASRPITDDESAALAPSFGDLTSPSTETVIAMDGIAIITHPNNKVDQLTTAQLKRIFTGEITNWSEVGGASMPIHVLARDQISGTHDAFVALVMQGAPIKSEHTFEDSEALARMVKTTEGAIGFVGLPYVADTKALAIQDGPARALLPTPFTVATEDYALSRRLFVYVPDSADPLVHELVEFAVSEAGQAIVGEVGFVPLSLRADASAIPAKAPTAYAKLATKATRLSVNFRFRIGSAKLDSKALRDLDRVTKYLATPINRGRHLALAGFADAQGVEGANMAIAKQRAEAIAELLKQRGVVPDEVASFGSAIPVAPNDTALGRARNRRVEVWVR